MQRGLQHGLLLSSDVAFDRAPDLTFAHTHAIDRIRSCVPLWPWPRLLHLLYLLAIDSVCFLRAFAAFVALVWFSPFV